MSTVLHRAGERGQGEYGWLSTRYSFSFADWHEPTRMGFGTLRVLNDDTIAPASGFGPHGHRDMEIITIVTEGAVTHEDSIGNTGVVAEGEVQVMSAGTGVVHAERNDSPSETLKLFQIWVEPKVRGLAPRYSQKAFDFDQAGPVLLVAPDEREGALLINQDAFITYANLSRSPYTYTLRDGQHGVYVFMISGRLEAAGIMLGERDALGIVGVREVTLTPIEPSGILIFEVPMIA